MGCRALHRSIRLCAFALRIAPAPEFFPSETSTDFMGGMLAERDPERALLLLAWTPGRYRIGPPGYDTQEDQSKNTSSEAL
jgi:hypothetical protein